MVNQRKIDLILMEKGRTQRARRMRRMVAIVRLGRKVRIWSWYLMRMTIMCRGRLVRRRWVGSMDLFRKVLRIRILKKESLVVPHLNFTFFRPLKPSNQAKLPKILTKTLLNSSSKTKVTALTDLTYKCLWVCLNRLLRVKRVKVQKGLRLLRAIWLIL